MEAKNLRIIYLIAVPSASHLNPTLCFVNSLIKKLDVMNIDRIVIYSESQFYDRILNLPDNIPMNNGHSRNNSNEAISPASTDSNIRNYIECRNLGLSENTGTSNLLKLIMDFDTKANSIFRIFKCFEDSFKVACRNIMKNLVQDIHRDKPELIIYDQAIFFLKLALNYYDKLYKEEIYRPMTICYVTTFAWIRGINPKWNELHLLGVTSSVKNLMITGYDFFKYIFVYYKLLLVDLRFSLKEALFVCQTPLAKNFLLNPDLNMVFLIPDIQPHIEKFLTAKYSHIKFVGSAIDENVRFQMKLNENLNNSVDIALKSISNQEQNAYLNENEKCLKIIEDYLMKQTCSVDYFKNSMNKIDLKYLRNGSNGSNTVMSTKSSPITYYHKPIIYVSMGNTFIYENGYLFDVIIETLKEFSLNYAIIVSIGNEKLYLQYNEKYKLSNILLMPYVPQVEVLKRTHLFLTHAGMNSISEAVHYGTPIVCIPLSGDQPFIAWHVTKELNMGIRLVSNENLTSEKLKSAMNEVLTDALYRQRATELSEISKRYPGHLNASELIVEYMLKKKKDKNHTEL